MTSTPLRYRAGSEAAPALLRAALGPPAQAAETDAELLAALDEWGDLRAPFVLWTSGNETYVDYVLRGVRKVAKIGG